jgi:hypothetical protein
MKLVNDDPQPTVVLWSMRYEQRGQLSRDPAGITIDNNQIIHFPPPSTDLAFDEAVLDSVEAAYGKIMGAEARGFLVFEDRNPDAEEDDDV